MLNANILLNSLIIQGVQTTVEGLFISHAYPVINLLYFNCDKTVIKLESNIAWDYISM